MALRPVHRIKHVIDAEGSVDDTPVIVVDLIRSVDSAALASPTHVEEGAKVNGIYLHVEVSHTSGVGRPNIYMIIFKNPGNSLSMPNPKAVGIDVNKKFVIHQEMILMSGDAGNGLPRPLFNGVIVIPPRLKRFGPGDRIQVGLVTGNSGVNADWCLQCHYKEFR